MAEGESNAKGGINLVLKRSPIPGSRMYGDAVSPETLSSSILGT